MIIGKFYLMLLETFLTSATTIHHFPRRSNSIIIELSKATTRPWMKNVTRLCS
jgi:hypothetical protein